MTPPSVRDVLKRTPRGTLPMLPPPGYAGGKEGDADRAGSRVGITLASMAMHMTDEAHQTFEGLRHAGYVLHGHGIGPSLTDVRSVCRLENPHTLLLQDQRELDGATAGGKGDPRWRVRNFEADCARDDLFRLTVLKDAQNNPPYHRQSAAAFNVHAWVVYYHPRIVAHLASYVRPQHLVRTYHSLDPKMVPPYASAGRREGVISGAVSGAYPLRLRLVRGIGGMPRVEHLKHPGYHRNGCATPHYLWTLSRYRVSVCTASVYGYALRKIVESVACGCVVVTDLPSDEVLPEIDGALVRVSSDATPRQVNELVGELSARYDPEERRHHAERALRFYDYRAVGRRLAADVEAMRMRYIAERASPPLPPSVPVG